MFVTKAHHAEVVRLLREELQRALAETAWYRRTFFANHGFHYPTEEAAMVAPSPSPQPVLSETEQRKTFRLDRSEWTSADAKLFQEFWEPEFTKQSKPFDEIEYWYYEAYGHSPPSQAWQA